MVHPGETGPPRDGEGGGGSPKTRNLHLPEAVLTLHFTREKPSLSSPHMCQKIQKCIISTCKSSENNGLGMS